MTQISYPGIGQAQVAVKASDEASPQMNGAAGSDNSASAAKRDKKNQENPSSQTNGVDLTPEELKLVEELKRTDQEVRQHEMAHVAAGGSLVTSGASFSYKTGPDGNRYAVAGEVSIDTAPVPGDPQATIDKMRQVKRAATAPAEPSSQDTRVAAMATAEAAKAMGELTQLMAKQEASQNETQAFGNARQASESYTKVHSLPEQDTHTFSLAV